MYKANAIFFIVNHLKNRDLIYQGDTIKWIVKLRVFLAGMIKVRYNEVIHCGSFLPFVKSIKALSEK